MQFHKIISSIFALAFLILVSSFDHVFRFLFAAVLVYAIVVGIYNYWYLKKQNFFSFWSWLRPMLLLGSTIGIYLSVPLNSISGMFLIAAAFGQFLIQLSIVSASEQKIFYETLFAIFGVFLTIFASRFFIFPLQTDIFGLPSNSVLLAGVFVLTLFVVRSSFDYIPISTHKKMFFAWLLSVVVLEVCWAIAYLPLTYTALTLILFNVFYAFWIVAYYHLYNNVSAKKIVFHLIFASFLIAMTFLTTPWRIIS